MKLYFVHTKGIYNSSDFKTFVVMASCESEIKLNLNNHCSTFSQFHDKIYKVVPCNGYGIRVE